MIVTTFSRDRISSISLPQKATGQYWLYAEKNTGSVRLVSVEGINGEWILKSNRQVKILNHRGEPIKNTKIPALSNIVVENADGERFIIFAEPITEDRQTFAKYVVQDGTVLNIGRVEQNDIMFDSKTVSSTHAKLTYRERRWMLQDEGSTNGTYVSQKRIDKTELQPGDMIFIMGMKIIIGNGFLAINNPDGKVRLNHKVSKLINQRVEPVDEDEEYELADPDYFYRSPRFKRDVETAKFTIDSPPTSPVGEEMPWMLVMGSSMAMGMMSVVTLVSAIISNNIQSMVMGGSMLIGTLLLPTLSRRYERKRKREKEALRQQKYTEYINVMTDKINEACKLQEEILNENHDAIRECESSILQEKRNLWERSIRQNDFLRVRVGRGNGTLDAELSYQERRFSIEYDNLQEKMYQLCEEPKELKNIPITYSLFDNHISGVIGKHSNVVDFAKGMIIQLASYYSYDEVKMVFFYDQEEADQFEFVRWLPHAWSDDNRFRFIATDPNEVKEISAYFEGIIETRIETNETEMEDVTPYYVIFSMSKKLAVRSEMIKKILNEKKNLYMSVVTFYEELKELPKECSMVVELDGNRGRLFDKDDTSGKSTEFLPDIKLSKDPMQLAVRLSNIPLDNLAANYQLPKTYTFLEMFGVGKVEHLNALSRWKENDPTKSLQAAVGVDTMGETFKLDLHEKFHGPHGLVAGMTGSGKSEFIITYILSLAVNYHPNEVAFILIDYKGGGMAKSFENLPHTAGIITNLDGAAIKRSLVSIESELRRRQAIFAAASKQVNVSNIDIYKYQKLYREGTVSEPLQHLFIISDEFAELKTQQPEFMTQLVSAARIGRSLGVHLILATQKPSGVVDDQIWSNSKFRVCLKVQERADSMDMLKRPDAAELVDTGRFYLQVGYNELFEMGQSAWSGAPYYPSDRVQKEKDNSVVVIDHNGHPLKEAKIDKKRAMFANAGKQLDVITDYLRKIADEENIHIRPLWLEPIPAVILLDELRIKYQTQSIPYVLNPVIGEYDDPAHQSQHVLRLPISEEGNAVIYGVAGSGKTSFLNAMIFSLIQEHTPEEVNIYILDFASETLRAFAKAPHVGDVILSYEEEKVSNLFKMLQSESERRKKLFADYGGDYSSYIKMSGQKLPSIVIAIHNFAAFTEMYEEKEEAVQFLSREGTKYGIYFVLTALGTGGVRFRLLQNFKQLLVLQLNDESDYSTVVGKTDGLFPSKFKGRGLIKTDELYEFQIASLVEDGLPFAYIQEACARLHDAWQGETAHKIPILPDRVNTEFLQDYLPSGNSLQIPIGVESHSLNVHYYPFGSRYINMVLSTATEAIGFTTDLAVLIGKYMQYPGVIFDPTHSVDQDTGSLECLATSADCEAGIAKLFETVLYRNNTYKDALDKGIECEPFDDMLVIINSITQLKESLGDEGNQKLSLILERGSLNYHIVIIIAEQVKTLTTVSYEKWYKANVSIADGIWVGGGITDQYQMKPSKLTAEMHDDLTAEFGFSLIKGQGLKVKLLKEKIEEDEYDQ